MSPTLLAEAAIVLLVIAIAMLAMLLRRTGTVDMAPLATRLDGTAQAQERGERLLRDEMARSREEAANGAAALRGEVAASVKAASDSTVTFLGELSQAQQAQLDGVMTALRQMTEAEQGRSHALRGELNGSLKTFGENVGRYLTQLAEMERAGLDAVRQQVGALATGTDQRLEQLRATVEERLERIRADNAQQLEQMRRTVDEKLHATLETRLGESFRQVSTQLEQVYRGLGEMQTLAAGVGDLKRVLQNVKVRGNWGEVQLGSLLEQCLAQEQYATNVATRAGSADRVEFAIKLPGRGPDDAPVWLPLDAKFPLDDYTRLMEAHERADSDGVEAAARELEKRIRSCAQDVSSKYLDPPHTTDFAILFLPTEGLYAEVVRRSGLLDRLQRECRVVVAGPTTLWALLNSLQMGFRTLAIQKRSSEVWTVLGAVKTEFSSFGDALEKVKLKLKQASTSIDQVEVRSRVMSKKLKSVEQMPADEARVLLGPGAEVFGAGVPDGAEEDALEG